MKRKKTMSKLNFEIPDINEKNNMTNLNTNVLKGFEQAIKLGQQRLALEYLNEILPILIAGIEDIESEKVVPKRTARVDSAEG